MTVTSPNRRTVRRSPLRNKAEAPYAEFSTHSRTLYPTKGWRYISDKRARAEVMLGQKQAFPFISLPHVLKVGRYIGGTSNA